MLTSEITRTYNANHGLYLSLKDEIVYEIEQALASTTIKYHSVIARVKTLGSLLTKVENKEVENPFEEVSDIVGSRIVTLFLSDIGKIVDLLKTTFDISFVDNKIEDTDPRLFGYFSVHLHAKIKASFIGTRYDRIKPLTFEIQIRTIAMDAWASASHYLAYKSEEDVPSDLKRDFNALSGLYYVADKHFEMFFRSRTANLKRMDRVFKSHNATLDVPLDLDSLISFLHERYPDRIQPKGSDAATLLEEIREYGIHDFAELMSRLDQCEERFANHEMENPPGIKPDDGWPEGEMPKFAAVGVVRISLRDIYPGIET